MKKLLLIPLILLLSGKGNSPQELARQAYRKGYIQGMSCAKYPLYNQGLIWENDSLKFEITINQ